MSAGELTDLSRFPGSFGRQQPDYHHHHLHYNNNHRRNPETLPRLHPEHESPGATRQPHLRSPHPVLLITTSTPMPLRSSAPITYLLKIIISINDDDNGVLRRKYAEDRHHLLLFFIELISQK